MILNVSVPASWKELTQEQMRYALFLLASGHYEPEQIKSLCLIRWGGLHPKEHVTGGYEVEHDESIFVIQPEQLAAFLPVMDFLTDRPDEPVRLEHIQGCRALFSADLQGLPFESWLALENLYQGYIRTRRTDLVQSMAAVLYENGKKPLRLTPAEAYGVFLWVAAVKRLFAQRFPSFFVSAPVDEQQQDTFTMLRKAMNTQIRALTKGDITKEKEILSLDVWRALTELDAQAEEYNELKKHYDNAGKS